MNFVCVSRPARLRLDTMLTTHSDKVIDSSDIVLHILDARDPLGTRCRSVEKYLKEEAPHKHLVFVLNKCDLVPTKVAVSCQSLSPAIFMLLAPQSPKILVRTSSGVMPSQWTLAVTSWGKRVSYLGISDFGRGGQMESVLEEVVGLGNLSPFELKSASFFLNTSPWTS